MSEQEQMHQDAQNIIKDFEGDEVISIFWLGGNNYAVYTDEGGYTYNIKTKDKELCNPDGLAVLESGKNIYTKGQ